MIKKTLVFLFVVAVVGVACLPWWTTHMADTVFQDFKDPMATKKIAKAMEWKMRLQMHSQAREIAEKAILYFPESDMFPWFIQKAAVCADKERKPRIALRWYRRFVEQFPKHEFAAEAKAKIERLRAVNED